MPKGNIKKYKKAVIYIISLFVLVSIIEGIVALYSNSFIQFFSMKGSEELFLRHTTILFFVLKIGIILVGTFLIWKKYEGLSVEIGKEAICAQIVTKQDSDIIISTNIRAEIIFGIEHDRLIGMSINDFLEKVPEEELLVEHEVMEENNLEELKVVANNGIKKPIFLKCSHIKYWGQEYNILSFYDITMLKDDLQKRKDLEGELLNARKLESIGTLAAGIAHEINSPIQFVGNNNQFLDKSMDKIIGLIEEYEKLLLEEAKDKEEMEKIIRKIERRYKYSFLKDETRNAISQSQEGIERISKIVKAMKDFSHMGREKMNYEDINEAIESTVIISKNEWKYYAELEVSRDSELPEVNCIIGDIKQVILNLVVNAAHAIKERMEKEELTEKGKITITTYKRGESVFITVKDTGTGIDEKNKDKVFIPFFTTKGVGVGTGQGLSISHKIITNKHGGKLTFTTEVGKGTEFFIELPINGNKEEDDE